MNRTEHQPGRTKTRASFLSAVTLLCCIATASTATESYTLIIDRFEQYSENEFRFDVLLQNTGTPFHLNDLQVEIHFDPGILPENTFISNDGLRILPGSSDLLYPPETATLNLAMSGERIVLITGEPMIMETAQKVDENQTLTVARIQFFVSYEHMLGGFNSTAHSLSICTAGSFAQKCFVNENGNKTSTGIVMNNVDFVNNISNLPLASHFFSGNGYWDEKIGNNYIHWNNNPETHPDFAQVLPGTHSNVIIKGVAIIESGKFVELSANIEGNGGNLYLLTGLKPSYELTLIPNGNNVSVTIYDENNQELDNPSMVEGGTSLILKTSRGFLSGTFIDWVDQNGNVLSQNEEFPFIMPSKNTTLTANWSSGSKMFVNDPKPASSKGNEINKQLHSALIIEPGAALTVNELHNHHEAGAEAIILQSNSSGNVTGSLIHNNDGVVATIERYVSRYDSNSPVNSWHMISSPVQGMSIRPEFVPDNPVIPPYVDFYKWDEAHTVTVNDEPVSGWWINSKKSGGVWNDAFESSFVGARGYLMAYGQPGKGYGDKIHRFSGAIETNAIVLSGLSHTPYGKYAGWHLLGNPFASAVNWAHEQWDRNNILGGPQLWDAPNASYTPVLDIIPAMAGFMIKTGGNGSLKILPEARLHDFSKHNSATGNNKQNDRDTHSDEIWQPPPHIRLVARDNEMQTAQTTIIVFRDDATNAYDPVFDTPFMAGFAPLFYSLSPQSHYDDCNEPPVKLALNNLPDLHNNVSVPLGFVKNSASSFQIELANAAINKEIWLEDRVEQSLFPLCHHYVYPFKASENDTPLRFVLHIKDDDSVDKEQGCLQTTGKPVFVASNQLLHITTYCKNNKLKLLALTGQKLLEADLPGKGVHTIPLPYGHKLVVARLQCDAMAYAEKILIR